jgi:hypothetical protein
VCSYKATAINIRESVFKRNFLHAEVSGVQRPRAFVLDSLCLTRMSVKGYELPSRI